MPVFSDRIHAITILNGNVSLKLNRGKYLTGVKLSKDKSCWLSYLGMYGNDKPKYLGKFDTELEAHTKWVECKVSYILELSKQAYHESLITLDEFNHYTSFNFVDNNQIKIFGHRNISD